MFAFPIKLFKYFTLRHNICSPVITDISLKKKKKRVIIDKLSSDKLKTVAVDALQIIRQLVHVKPLDLLKYRSATKQFDLYKSIDL